MLGSDTQAIFSKTEYFFLHAVIFGAARNRKHLYIYIYLLVYCKCKIIIIIHCSIQRASLRYYIHVIIITCPNTVYIRTHAHCTYTAIT